MLSVFTVPLNMHIHIVIGRHSIAVVNVIKNNVFTIKSVTFPMKINKHFFN